MHLEDKICLATIVKIKIMSEMQPTRAPSFTHLKRHLWFVSLSLWFLYFQSQKEKPEQSMLISIVSHMARHWQTEKTLRNSTCLAKNKYMFLWDLDLCIWWCLFIGSKWIYYLLIDCRNLMWHFWHLIKSVLETGFKGLQKMWVADWLPIAEP